MSRSALRLTLVIAISATSIVARAQTSVPMEPASRNRLAFGLGFSHWFGPTFGSPDGYTTPMFSAGIRPGVSFFEIKARYTRSATRQTLPDGSGAFTSFAGLELVVCKELRVGQASLNGFAGPVALVTNTGHASFGAALGAVLGAEYMVRTGLGAKHALGFFAAAHEIFYTLPNDTVSLFGDPRRDAQIDLGIVTALF